MHETKLTKRIHTHNGAGYAIWVTQADIRHQGVVAVVWREKAGCKIEGIANYNPNVVIFLLTTGLQRWYIVRGYVPPNDTPTVVYVEKSLGNAAEGVKCILLDDLIARLL